MGGEGEGERMNALNRDDRTNRMNRVECTAMACHVAVGRARAYEPRGTTRFAHHGATSHRGMAHGACAAPRGDDGRAVLRLRVAPWAHVLAPSLQSTPALRVSVLFL